MTAASDAQVLAPEARSSATDGAWPAGRAWSQAATLEARFGARVCATLDAGTRNLPRETTERLRLAREKALAAHGKAVLHRPALTRADRPALTGEPGRWWKWASVLPLLVLVAGLVAIMQWEQLERADAAAEVDAALLADDLPPDAYTDPGFAEFLDAASPARP